MKKFIGIPFSMTMLLCFMLTQIVIAQDTSLEKISLELKESNLFLNKQEKQTVELYKRKELYSSYSIINSAVLPSLHKKGSLLLKLPDLADEVQSFTKSIRAHDQQNYTWITEFRKLGGEAILICEDGNLYGSISFHEKSYKIIAIKKGVSMILALDNEKMKDVKVCSSEINNTDKKFKSVIQSRDPCTVIDLLVMYTDDAATALGGVNIVNQEANTLVTQMNTAYSNSSMSGSINLVGIQNIDNIQEDEPVEDVLDEFETEGATAKSNANADIALLIYDSGNNDAGFSGIGPPNAFSVVDESFVNNRFVGSHELGHLMGGEHERCTAIAPGAECDDNGANPHAHKFLTGPYFNRTLRSTIMRSNFSGAEINNYSNPNVNFLNRPTGVSNLANNALVFNQNLCTVANYEQNYVPPVATINGPSSGFNNTYYNWYGTSTDCPGPAYTWQYSYNGFSYYNGGTSGSYGSLLPQDANLYLKVTVACSNGQSDVGWKTVYNLGNMMESPDVVNRESSKHDNTNAIVEFDVYPNPSLGNITVNFNNKGATLGDTQIIIRDILGNIVFDKKVSSRQLIHCNIQTAGTYFISALKNNRIETKKLMIL